MSALHTIEQAYIDGLQARLEEIARTETKAKQLVGRARHERKIIERGLQAAKRRLASLGRMRELPVGKSSGAPPAESPEWTTEQRREAVLAALEGDPLTRVQIAAKIPGGGRGLHMLLAPMLKEHEIQVVGAAGRDDPLYGLPPMACADQKPEQP